MPWRRANAFKEEKETGCRYRFEFGNRRPAPELRARRVKHQFIERGSHVGRFDSIS